MGAGANVGGEALQIQIPWNRSFELAEKFDSLVQLVVKSRPVLRE